MKTIKNWNVTGFSVWSVVAKGMLASLLLAHLCFGVLTLKTTDNDSWPWTGGRMQAVSTVLQEEEVHPYVVAGETETGIIIIGGGGMMLLSNQGGGRKRKSKNTF